MIKVKFSDGSEINIAEGTKLSEAIKQAGFLFDLTCGGKGICGKCRVQVAPIEGMEVGVPEEVLACSYEVNRDIWVQSSGLKGDTGAVILTDSTGTSVTAGEDNGITYAVIAADDRYGLAVDIGTTTVVGYLMNLSTGGQTAVGAELNRQRIYGADVISRITAAQSSPDNLRDLQRLIVETVNSIVDTVSAKVNISPEQITAVTLAGNTCMHHLVLGLNPKSLGRAPFQPVVQQAVTITARELGLKVKAEADIWVFPVVAGFVGGDTVSAVIATELPKLKGIRLLVDIGTNGELVLSVHGRMTACSAAAGPALEGAQVSCGMRAEAGAISRVKLTPEIRYEVIGNTGPRGLCGSGLIDLLGELVRAKAISRKGGFVKPPQFTGPQYLRDRILPGEKGYKFVLLPAEDNQGREISLTQDDILQLQLAKGALHTAMELLVRKAGITGEQVEQILLAGAFGNFMDKEQALEIGLFPPWAQDKILPVGNAAGEGAKIVLLSGSKREEAAAISKEIGFLELAGTAEFSDEFINGILFRNAR